MNKISKTNIIRTLFYISFVILIFLSISIGVKEFSFLGFITGKSDDSVFLAFISRIPRTMSIIITGASLSISGLIMQTITGNKFVSPSTSGTMAWCKCGIVITMLIFSSQSKIMKVSIAFIIALVGTWIFVMLLQSIQFKNALMVPLVGMMLGNVVNSFSTFFAYKYDMIQNVSSWLQGDFSLIIKGNYEILYLGIPFFIIAYFYANYFTIAGMGKSFSTNLGLNHKYIVLIGLTIVSFITSLVVVTIGSIQFVGLVIPNIISIYKGDNLKGTLFDTAALGAFFVMSCDIIGRVIISPFEINVNVIVSVFGSLIFIYILYKKSR